MTMVGVIFSKESCRHNQGGSSRVNLAPLTPDAKSFRLVMSVNSIINLCLNRPWLDARADVLLGTWSIKVRGVRGIVASWVYTEYSICTLTVPVLSKDSWYVNT